MMKALDDRQTIRFTDEHVLCRKAAINRTCGGQNNIGCGQLPGYLDGFGVWELPPFMDREAKA